LSVMDQVARVEEILKKLNLIKRERSQVLKDLKEKVHNDDISQVLILNKKSISNYETQLFQAELEKFRPHQNRLLSAVHKQSQYMKELTSTFNDLLQDKRVRAEQSKYENITRQRSSVISKYRKIYQEFLDLEAGLQSAKQWYSEMKDTVDSLEKNVETFVNNRRSEGAQLLSQIEQDRASSSGQADRERERLRGLMERMSMDPSGNLSSNKLPRTQSLSHHSPSPSARYPATNLAGQYQVPNSPPPQATNPQQARASLSNPSNGSWQNQYQRNINPGPVSQQSLYNPGTYPQSQPTSAPPTQTQFSQNQQPYSRTPHQPSTQQQQYVPPRYDLPGPPPGPPPLGPQQTFQQPGASPVAGNGEYGYGNNASQQRGGQQPSSDPWAGLNAWK